jgi:hypothetical protein
MVWGIGAELQLRMWSWSAAQCQYQKQTMSDGDLIALFFKAEYRLNRAELEEACLGQFCRAHSWHSESYMVLGYWSWTSTSNVKLKCGPMPIPKADYADLKMRLIALFFKAEYRLNRAELEEACLRQFCRAHSWHSEPYMVWEYWSWTSLRMRSWSAAQCQSKSRLCQTLKMELDCIIFKAEYRLNRAELEEACLWQFCRAHSWHSEYIWSGGIGAEPLECEVEVSAQCQYQKRTIRLWRWSFDCSYLLKAEYRLNRSRAEEACMRQYCRAHSWHSESHMAWGYWSWTSTFECEVEVRPTANLPGHCTMGWSLIALFLKAEYRLKYRDPPLQS